MIKISRISSPLKDKIKNIDTCSQLDGDGVFESIDINNDGISDYLSIEGENFIEALEFIF